MSKSGFEEGDVAGAGVVAGGAGAGAAVAGAATGTAGEGLGGAGAGWASGLAVMVASGGGCETPEYGSEFVDCCANAVAQTASVTASAA
jgi:hypothetical protein